MRCDLESTEALLQHYSVKEDVGRTKEEVKELREKYGWNELEKEEPTPLWELILEQFDDTLVKILLAAAAISFVLATIEENGDEGVSAYVEPIVILVILILNAIVGVWQESNAEAALEALKDLQSENARVLRDGTMVTVPARELVPGDIVQVRTGDRVPADMRLIWLKTTSLSVEQAQLTGESVSIAKDIDPLPPSTEDLIQAKTNMLFATTIVVSGMGRGLVVETGMDTEIGQIQKSVQEAASEDDTTPLKKKLDEFGDMLSKVILIICIIVWVINYKHFSDPTHGSYIKGCIYYFKIAVALAVAAIPEGLPAVITTCLALGTRKMAKKNAIVRKLPSVETLGCTNVICSDKTGTLTTNEMSCVVVAHLGTSDSEMTTYEVEGTTYSPEGRVLDMVPLSSNTKHLNMLAAICSRCNESTIEYDGSKYVRIGEPTEAALSVLVEKMGVPDKKEQAMLNGSRSADPAGTVHRCSNYWESKYPVVATLEFHRDRKSMSVLCGNGKGKNLLMVKGAPEGLVDRCSQVMLSTGKIVKMTPNAKKQISKQVEAMASKALRCLAVAYKEESGELGSFDGDRHHPAQKRLSKTESFAEIESDMVFVGLVGMLDPPRPEIAPMIEVCHTAGIRVIMITGDNKLTAESICRMVGIFDESEPLDHVSFTGSEFFSLPDEKQIKLLTDTDSGLVFSRTEPKHKQQLVRLLKKHGDIVAMTGDGVNDAPALKQADIGIAMGIAGTEVAKEASDMVLADDNFATIVSAVAEGRAIYDNMQAFIRYLISSNIGEVAGIFFTAALGLPEGLLPVQLLWVNLVTDGPPATALGFNPADADIMKKAPRRADEELISGWVFFRMMVVGIYVGFSCVAILAYWYMYYEASGDGHTLVSYYQLTHFTECSSWDNFEVNNFDGMDFSSDPCKYFIEGKVKASTLSLSVLVTIEMLNAFNALSEDGSLLTKPAWVNPFLLIATFASFAMHFLILYVPVLSKTFGVAPLDWNEWALVLAFSAPVIVIDEVLKYFSRRKFDQATAQRLKEKKLH